MSHRRAQGEPKSTSALRQIYDARDYSPILSSPLDGLADVRYPDKDHEINQQIDDDCQEAAELSGPDNSILPGWPSRIPAEFAWSGKDLANEDLNVLGLDKTQQQEIETATRIFKGKGLELDDISKDTFKLESLASILSNQSKRVQDGCGYVLIRGINPTNYSPRDNAIILLGLSTFFGDQRGRQSPSGSKLGHIFNVKASEGKTQESILPIYNNVAQPFHTDTACTVLALYALNVAGEGGVTSLCPLAPVYNELSSDHPDVLQMLASPIWDQDPYDDKPRSPRPVLYNVDGRIIMNFSPLISNQRVPESTSCTAQEAASQVLQDCARKHQVSFNLQHGDMLLVNNLTMLHSRSKFKDAEDLSGRHVLRLWLNDSKKSSLLPDVLHSSWQKAFGHASSDAKGRYDIGPSEYLAEAMQYAHISSGNTCSVDGGSSTKHKTTDSGIGTSEADKQKQEEEEKEKERKEQAEREEEARKKEEDEKLVKMVGGTEGDRR